MSMGTSLSSVGGPDSPPPEAVSESGGALSPVSGGMATPEMVPVKTISGCPSWSMSPSATLE
jgi:hypothetical protein